MGRIRLEQTLSSEAVKKWNSFETISCSELLELGTRTQTANSFGLVAEKPNNTKYIFM